MPIIELPDGNEAEFPDDLPMPELKKAVSRYWVQKTQGQMGPIERFGHGVGNVAYGLSQMAARALPQEARGVAARPIEAIDRAINERHTDYENRKPAGTDYASMAGEIAATLPLAFIGGGLPGAAAAGAIAGASAPVTDDDGDYWATKAGQAGMGAVGGAAGAVAGRVMGAIFGGTSSKTAPAAKALLKEGITPTPGQSIGPGAAIAEEKLQSLPFLGQSIANSRKSAIDQANVAVYNRALGPIGKKSSGSVGPEGVAEVHRNLSQAYDELAPKLNVSLDNLAVDLSDTLTKAEQYLPKAKMGDFEAKLTTALKMGNFKDAESYLSFFATKYGGAANPDDQLLGDAFENVLDTARESLAKQNPQYASRLRQINEGWRGFSIIRDAAVSAEKAGREAFTPEELNRAVARSAMRGGAAGQGAFAENRAFMQDLSRPMLQVLGKKYPDSGTAGRMLTATPQGLLFGAVAAPARFMYQSKLLKQAAAGAVLSRPEPIGQLAGGAARAIGKGAAPGTGLVLSQTAAADDAPAGAEGVFP